MFRTIVVPVDGTEVAEQVIDFVSPLRARDGTVHLVRVVAGGAKPTPLQQAHVVEATSYLEFLKKERSEPFETRVLRGDVAAAVLKHARAVGADLVALSARGEGGSSRFVFGSAAGRLAAAAECPVLVSPARAGDVAGEHGRRDRVLVALDGSPPSEAAILPAAEVARHQGAVLVLVHVVEAFSAADDSAAARLQARKVKEMEARLRQLTARTAASGVRTLPLIVRGDPASEILAQAERRRAQLLCLSVTARGFADRLFFGSVAEKVIPRAPVPLLLVRRG